MAREFKIGIGALISIVGDDVTQWQNRVDIFRQQDAEFGEVWLEPWRGVHWMLDEKLPTLEKLLSGIEIILHAPFQWSSLITPVQAIRDWTLKELRATISLGEALGARGVTVHGGFFYIPYLRREVDAKAILAENLESLLPLAERAGQFLAVENIHGSEQRRLGYPVSAQDLKEIAAAVPGIRCTFDIGHAYQNGEPPIERLKSVLPHVANIHLHDFNNRGEAHLPLESGVLELDAILSLLLDEGYGGYVTLEVFDFEENKPRIRESYRCLRRRVSALSSRRVCLERRFRGLLESGNG